MSYRNSTIQRLREVKTLAIVILAERSISLFADGGFSYFLLGVIITLIENALIRRGLLREVINE